MSQIPKTDQAPVSGTTAGQYTFDQKVAAVIISNTTGVVIKVKFDSHDITANRYDAVIENNSSAWYTKKLYKMLSIWIPSGASVSAATLSIVGEGRI